METNPDQLPAVHLPTQPVPPLLRGQKALVTGANSGIGRAVAIAMGQAGADVIVNYVRNEATASKVVAEASKNGSKAIAIQADVSNEQQVQVMFQKMIAAFGTSTFS